jgi:asparagine synthase (glutamine-hydrolysing)
MFTPSLKRRTYNPDFARIIAGADPIGNYAEQTAARGGLAGLLHADTCFYLPNDMLVKVDRMSMAHGLEVRVPFLDTKLVSFCANLPADYKLARGKVRKHILRESLRDSLPPDILDRPKSGFNIPVEAWMRGKLRDLLFDSVRGRRQELSGLLKPDAVETLAEEHRMRRADHGHVLFTVMMLALWFENRARAWRAVP